MKEDQRKLTIKVMTRTLKAVAQALVEISQVVCRL